VERVGHHSRGENVIDRERPASVVNRLGIGVAVVADRGGHPGELLGRRAVHVHVPARHEGELGRREKPPGNDEFVSRTGPWRGRSALGVDARLGRDEQHDLGEPGGDRGSRFEHHVHPELHAHPGRAEPEVVDERGAVAPGADAVDIGEREPGVGERRLGRGHVQRAGRLAFQPPGLTRVVHPDDAGASPARCVGQQKSDPPSTLTFAPVMYVLRGEATKAMTAPISAGSPARGR
jgi:hypothetical protein